MQEQIFLAIGILAAIVSLSAAFVLAAGMASVNAQNMSGNATGGNMTAGGNMTNATAGGGNMTSPPLTSPTPTQ